MSQPPHHSSSPPSAASASMSPPAQGLPLRPATTGGSGTAIRNVPQPAISRGGWGAGRGFRGGATAVRGSTIPQGIPLKSNPSPLDDSNIPIDPPNDVMDTSIDILPVGDSSINTDFTGGDFEADIND